MYDIAEVLQAVGDRAGFRVDDEDATIAYLERLFADAAEGSDEQAALLRAILAAHRRRVVFILLPALGVCR